MQIGSALKSQLVHPSELSIFSALGEFQIHGASQPIWPIYLKYAFTSFRPG